MSVQVEQKVNKMQRQYFLQEQLKIIKRELGLEVRGQYMVWCNSCQASVDRAGTPDWRVNRNVIACGRQW